MLRFLRVSHLAVIDSVEVEFDAGLNVLTGETGAGKSILVGAVGLLLGGRASGDLVRTGEGAAIVEAIFESGGEELLVRREITAQGRSRAFVNGSLVTAGGLKDLAARLIELHGQHEHQTLLDSSTHLAVLDAFGQLEPLTVPVRVSFEAMTEQSAALDRARRMMADRSSRNDLLTFQLSELDRADLGAARAGGTGRAGSAGTESADDRGEDVELAALRQVLVSAERVERLCEESYSSLYESDSALLGGLGAVWRRVAELAALDPRFQPYLDARDGIKGQLEDLAMFLRRYADGIEASPARLQRIEERLALLERLKRKYGPTLADVVARRDAMRAELAELEQGDSRIAELERSHAESRRRYLADASVLSAARREAASRFSRELEALLGELAMERTRFDVRFGDAADVRPGAAPRPAAPARSGGAAAARLANAVESFAPFTSTDPGKSGDPGAGADPVDSGHWTAEGVDVAEFFVSPNPGEDLRPLARIVSGGELSRIMLAIKTLTFGARLAGGDGRSRGAGAPGLIFDEVDAGIGGRVADVVGRKLRALGSAFQVLCITHLPQIAAYADTHFAIDKQIDRDRTSTTVRRLEDDARVSELARMLGGEAITEGLRASAREMLAERAGAKGERKGKGESERAKAKRPAAARKN